MSSLHRRSTSIALFVVLTFVLTLAAGCSRADRFRTSTPRSITTSPTQTTGPDAYERSGRTSSLRVTIPPATTPRPYPLVIALHSLHHDGTEPKAEWGLDELAATAGFAVAYPDGLNRSWNAGTCCGQAAAEQVEDVTWLRSLISHLEQHYPIDRRRVSLVGFSNGGMLAYRYACEYSSEVAGIAVVAASLQVPGCTPTAPVTVLAIHGQLDDHVPYGGASWSKALGTSLTTVEGSLAPFRARAGCPTPAQPADTVATDGDGNPLQATTAGAGPVPDAEATSRGNQAQLESSARSTPHSTSKTSPRASSTSTDTGEQVRIRRETTCSSDKRIVEFLLPGVAHGWPPVTGPARFSTAQVIWQLLGPMRSAATGPNL